MVSINNSPPDLSSTPSHDTHHLSPKSHLLPLTVLLILVITGSLLFYLSVARPDIFRTWQTKIYKSINKEILDASPSPTPIPTRSPYPLKADQGTAGTFSISQSHKVGPIFTKFVIDPIVPQSENDIVITLTIKSELEIKSLTGKITGDENPIPLSLSRVSRVKNIETWTSSYKLTEPVDYTYVFNFTASDGTTDIVFDLPLRTD